jgi:coproporphyrinogen III oxidase-like Fe-S oxidoreductase
MGRRYTMAADVEAYLAGRTAPAVEELDGLTLMKESFLMGFRFIEGPGEALFRRRFGASPEDFIPQTAAAWRRRGLLAPGRIALTREGLLLLNAFLLDCWRELDGI